MIAAGGDIADDAVEQRTRFLDKGRAHFLHELAAVSGLSELLLGRS